MVRRFFWVVVIALLVGNGTASAQSETAMSDDVRRMHERLVLLSKGEGSTSELRIEFMEGSMVAHRSFNIEGRKLVSKQWRRPGSEMIHLEGSVTDARVHELLEQLIAKEYWTFEGTRFVPDAPVFLFRFYYGNLAHVDFRCDLAEAEQSPARLAIRDVFLQFVDEIEMQPVSAK